MPSTYGVVDLFAGPGGLGEGFASFADGGRSPFTIEMSIEKEQSAHRTLRLRAFVREYQARHGGLPTDFIRYHAGQTAEPNWMEIDEEAWRRASAEAKCLELGTSEAAATVDSAKRTGRRSFDDLVVIGGPPCQAYSLVGRARAKGIRDYVPEQDQRHFLFREYIRVLDELKPAAFVMENVKGILSSKVESRLVFEMLMEDLSSLGTGRGQQYELKAIQLHEGVATLVEPRDSEAFVVRAEDFGVPQRRHRVIVIGLRSDVASGMHTPEIAVPAKMRSVFNTIGNLPRLRSGISKTDDSDDRWLQVVLQSARRLANEFRKLRDREMQEAVESLAVQLRSGPTPPRTWSARPRKYATSNDGLMQWLERKELRAIALHETRSHMESDLMRYLFVAVFGQVKEYSPKAMEFPEILRPAHRSWKTGVFADRFRVQLATSPSTTVTSHISKDGHYFIHPDPTQCRSLTVREAARLQTFPDDYLFLGNRTQQYVQVGNAVPPFLARQIAGLVFGALQPRVARSH